MYEQFFNFSAEPFRLSPDHAFAYAHKDYSKAQAYMVYAFHRAEGFVMITGRPGTGKTTLIGALLDQLAGEEVTTANLVCTQLKADDLLKMVAYEFGISSAVVEKGELLQRLTQQLKFWHRDARRALLIVDEAQDLSPSAMEELRLLTNIQLEGKPLLQIFLLGQPELRELILSPRMEQVHQRIIAASHIQPLENDETGAYIRHRLESVGWQGDPAVSEAVYPLIHKFSEGIPRRINLICSRLLLHCAVDERHQIKVAHFREVLGELQDENLAAGRGFNDQDFEAAEKLEAEMDRKAEIDRKAKKETPVSNKACAAAVEEPVPANTRAENPKPSSARVEPPVSRKKNPVIPPPQNGDAMNDLYLKAVPENLKNATEKVTERARVPLRKGSNGTRTSAALQAQQQSTRRQDPAIPPTAPAETRRGGDRRVTASNGHAYPSRTGRRITTPAGDEVAALYEKNRKRLAGKSNGRKGEAKRSWLTLLILVGVSSVLVLLIVLWPLNDIVLPRFTCVVSATGCSDVMGLEESHTKNIPGQISHESAVRE